MPGRVLINTTASIPKFRIQAAPARMIANGVSNEAGATVFLAGTVCSSIVFMFVSFFLVGFDLVFSTYIPTIKKNTVK